MLIIPVKNGVIIINDIRDRFFVEGSFENCWNPGKCLFFHPNKVIVLMENKFEGSFKVSQYWVEQFPPSFLCKKVLHIFIIKKGGNCNSNILFFDERKELIKAITATRPRLAIASKNKDFQNSIIIQAQYFIVELVEFHRGSFH